MGGWARTLVRTCLSVGVVLAASAPARAEPAEAADQPVEQIE